MAEAEASKESTTPLDLLKRFYRLQEERVEAYQFLESGFSAYLESAPNYNFDLYRSLVHEITQSFKTISAEAMSIATQFQETHAMGRLADCIHRVQKDEEDKLQQTVSLQLSRQSVADNPDDAFHTQQVADLKEKLQEIVQTINDHMEDLKYESEDLYGSEGADR